MNPLPPLLRDLPEPVVTYATYETLMGACARREAGTACDLDWAREVVEAVEMMPVAHRGTLAFLVRLLREVAALSAVNRCGGAS